MLLRVENMNRALQYRENYRMKMIFSFFIIFYAVIYSIYCATERVTILRRVPYSLSSFFSSRTDLDLPCSLKRALRMCGGTGSNEKGLSLMALMRDILRCVMSVIEQGALGSS